jgi:hypothetical protein
MKGNGLVRNVVHGVGEREGQGQGKRGSPEGRYITRVKHMAPLPHS